MVGEVVVGIGPDERGQVGDRFKRVAILVLTEEGLPFVALIAPAWSPQRVQVALGQPEPDRHDVSSHGAQPNDGARRPRRSLPQTAALRGAQRPILDELRSLWGGEARATASWRCSERRWLSRTTHCAPAWLPWRSSGQGMAAEIDRQDGVSLLLRVGLNSGQVIAGEFGSAAIGYTAIGEQVGMAQQMESAAPPGGVMLSDSTGQLVGRAVILGEPEMVAIKGADAPVLARRLLGVASERERTGPAQSTLVGHGLELHTMTGL